jgi:hypothetical protein
VCCECVANVANVIPGKLEAEYSDLGVLLICCYCVANVFPGKLEAEYSDLGVLLICCYCVANVFPGKLEAEYSDILRLFPHHAGALCNYGTCM